MEVKHSRKIKEWDFIPRSLVRRSWGRGIRLDRQIVHEVLPSASTDPALCPRSPGWTDSVGMRRCQFKDVEMPHHEKNINTLSHLEPLLEQPDQLHHCHCVRNQPLHLGGHQKYLLKSQMYNIFWSSLNWLWICPEPCPSPGYSSLPWTSREWWAASSGSWSTSSWTPSSCSPSPCPWTGAEACQCQTFEKVRLNETQRFWEGFGLKTTYCTF